MITVRKVPGYVPPPSINLGRQEFREIRQLSHRIAEIQFDIHDGKLELTEAPNRAKRIQQLETLRICTLVFLQEHNKAREAIKISRLAAIKFSTPVYQPRQPSGA